MAKVRVRNYWRPFTALGAELAAFNVKREEEFGRGPDAENRLPIPFTMVGGDIPDDSEAGR